ncbi:hypothetical protein COU58_04165 [Candidatus Pacearchaeota archaeon CG10_big_fil_rev_8_21_14_0_10_32_42]|nr:MAG: hypothetical protein COU58_04165 [Candidatus Pacearchaeota archaeon CG10_big_fil_rev_8_21_14_0_10_32_42]
MKKAPLFTLMTLLFAVSNPQFKNSKEEENLLIQNLDSGDLKNPSFSTSYLSKFNLSETLTLEKGKEVVLNIPKRSLLNLDDYLLNLNPDSLESVTYPSEKPVIFSKFSYILNETDQTSKVKIMFDSNSVLNVTTDFSKVRNGPFLVIPENEELKVRSFYGIHNVIPMKVLIKKGEEVQDEIKFIDEKYYPPYFVSKKLADKDSLDYEEVKKILDSYENIYGDYFKMNYKALVCTDAATLILKTVGINLEEELDRNKIYGNSYRQKNVSVIKNYVNKIDPHKIHLFKNGDLQKILKYGEYSDLIPENFGIKSFSPGQILLFTRFYNTGPKKGKIQREDVHFGVVYGVNEKGDNIIESSMVSSRKGEPPYDKLIQLTTLDFKDWYKSRSHYTGSDETSESLTYRIYGIIDWIDTINKIKRN